MSNQESSHQILSRYWGYSAFREKQEDIINAVLENTDTLALLPTGGGKSICFQIPALMKEGICIVISPLIALMQDQVQNLKRKGIKAIAITSGMSKREIDIGLDNAAYGNFKFLYVSPERLATDLFKARLKKMNVNLIAVDEAHCISQWGYDFRPSYLTISNLRKEVPNVPVIALTATATKKVVIDIQNKLEFIKENVIQKSFERTNLAYVVIRSDDHFRKMLSVIDGVPGSGIVYVSTRKKTKEVAKFLLEHKISADLYHAGLSHAEREEKQKSWVQGKTRVIVATNAFGMGIDKPDVRFVIHLDLPQSLESYYQEAGRAGRDERKAYAVLIHSPSMSSQLKEKVEKSFPEIADIKRTYQALANHFQIPLNGGLHQTYDFDIKAFSNQYKMDVYSVYNSIHFLEKESYLSISENFYSPSTIHISISKEDLYKFQVSNRKYDHFIKTLLRTYGGTFDGFVNINENDLAKNAKSSTKDVIDILKRLNTLEIIDYQEKSSFPRITYTRERVNQKDLKIAKKNYIDRKNNALEQSKAVIKYAENNTFCRSNLLLNYFGESTDNSCGKCDVCIEKNKTNLKQEEFDAILKQIYSILVTQPTHLKRILEEVKGFPNEKIIKVLEFETDNNRLSSDGINIRLP